MQTRWRRSKHCVFNIGYHLIWCSKYRRKVLINEVENRLKELLLKKANDVEVNIETMEIMSEHVHLFVKSPPTNAIHYIVNQFKGYTSNILRTEFKHLKSKMPSLWTRSYYCETVGHISEGTIKKYIEAQKNI